MAYIKEADQIELTPRLNPLSRESSRESANGVLLRILHAKNDIELAIPFGNANTHLRHTKVTIMNHVFEDARRDADALALTQVLLDNELTTLKFTCLE
jgi:hypothetical protein